ncbi:MAG: GC-type dockerin domain-anchored protein [Planctomycetota bacterium]
MSHARRPIARSCAAAQRLSIAAIAGLLLGGTAAAEDMEWVNPRDLSSSGGFAYGNLRTIAQAFSGTSDLNEATAFVVGVRVEGTYVVDGQLVGDGLSFGDSFELSYRTGDALHYPDTFRAPIARFSQADGSLAVIETENVNFEGRSSVFELRHAPVEIELTPAFAVPQFGSPLERRYYFELFNDADALMLWITGSDTNSFPALQSDGCLGGYDGDLILNGNLGFTLLIEGAPPSAELITSVHESMQLSPWEIIPQFPDTASGPTTCVGEVSPNGDGAINLTDFSCYLSWWANASPQADITMTGTCDLMAADCVVDLSDFACYLSLWADAQP